MPKHGVSFIVTVEVVYSAKSEKKWDVMSLYVLLWIAFRRSDANLFALRFFLSFKIFIIYDVHNISCIFFFIT